MKSIAQYLTRQVLLSGITLALFGAFVVFAWTGPTVAPPNGNVDAPINVGSTNQVKAGGLSVGGVSGGFAVNASAYIQDRLGIANANPAYPLDVTGDIHNVGNMYSDGYFHNSDAHLKDNIAPLNGLDIISQLTGVSFNWKKDGTPSIGVIAQEVEAVLPSAVHTDVEGMKSVDYAQLIAPLIEAVKEQQAEIDVLKAEIEQLKK